jgi:hypothetical protein
MTAVMPQSSRPARRNAPFGSPKARNAQNAQRNYERYLALARAEALAGDRIVAENYFQHAEHYFRSLTEEIVRKPVVHPTVATQGSNGSD